MRDRSQREETANTTVNTDIESYILSRGNPLNVCRSQYTLAGGQLASCVDDGHATISFHRRSQSGTVGRHSLEKLCCRRQFVKNRSHHRSFLDGSGTVSCGSPLMYSTLTPPLPPSVQRRNIIKNNEVRYTDEGSDDNNNTKRGNKR